MSFEQLSTILPWAIAGFWLLIALLLVKVRTSLIVLHKEPHDLEGTGLDSWPSLSILVPAKDEADMVGKAVSSLLALDYPNLEVVAINDRSTDETGAILDALALKKKNLKVIHVGELPEGWLGKNHANHLGTEAATGEYLLFTDGDVVHGRSSLKKAISAMLRRDLDHMTGLPYTVLEGFFERLAVVGFSISFLLFLRPWTISGKRKKRNGDLGIGAFNLVRSKPYRKAGGHQPLAMEVADDVKLGRLLGRAGASQALALLGRKTWLTWHKGMGGLFRGLEKNMFAGVGFNPFVAVLSVLMVLISGLSPLLPLLFLPAWQAWVGSGLCFLVLMAMASGTNVHGRWSFLYGLGYPLGAGFMAAVMANSTWVTLRQGGIRWRETFYPLKALRNGRYK